ncbi:MAG: CPBP family intramembrane glutamic endopeptidase [Pirellulaceae bacterium]
MSHTNHRNLALALVVEGGLGLVAFGIGWLLGHSPAIGMAWDRSTADEQLRAIGLGVLATLPVLVALVGLDRLSVQPIERVKDLASQVIHLMFPRPRWWQLALVAAAAGLGEELLFRGLLQAGLSKFIGLPAGPWIALLVASLVFGAFHWLDTTYALLAAVAGLYFGGLLLLTESLWPPIVAHALYDFFALCYVLRTNKTVRYEV